MFNKYYQQLNKNALPLLSFSCMVFICLALMRYIAMPEWGCYLRSTEKLNMVSNNLLEKNCIAVKERLVAVNDSLESAKFSLSHDLVETKNLPGILQLIIKEANAADIKFVKMQPPSDLSKSGAGNYPLVLALTATYNSLGQFVSSIERLPHIMRTDRIAITAGRNNTLDARIQLTCFLHPNGL